jgi:hypothetical protein
LSPLAQCQTGADLADAVELEQHVMKEITLGIHIGDNNFHQINVFTDGET